MQELFEQLKRYVGFTAADEAALSRLGPLLSGELPRIAELFYARILEHDDARRVLERGERSVGHLKGTLVVWMGELFQGPWDTGYLARRARIGQVHVRIGLPQHYMVTAMNVVRRELTGALAARTDVTGGEGRAAMEALERVLDLDLAVMLHTYKQDMDARRAADERLATYGQLVGSIGHELRNPLGVIETSLYVLRAKGPQEPATEKHLDRIARQVTLANDIITKLLDLIRERPTEHKTVELAPLLETAVAQVEQLEETTVTVAPLPEGLAALGDATQLHQLVVNLVSNAVQAVAPKGEVRLTAAREDGRVRLDVDDSGPGLDAAVKARLFEPLVTTRSRGIGLGLALVKRIVDRHGGTIEAGRGPLGGARFTVRLPEARR